MDRFPHFRNKRPKHPLEAIIAKTNSLQPSEGEIQKAILEYLTYKGYFCWRNNTGAVTATYKGRERFFQYGLKGSGDILGMTKAGQFFSIEVKAKGKKPSPNQVEFIDRVNKSNGMAFVAHCLEDVLQRL